MSILSKVAAATGLAFQAANGQPAQTSTPAPTVQAAQPAGEHNLGSLIFKILEIKGNSTSPSPVDVVDHDTFSVDSKLYAQYQKETGSTSQVIDPNQKSVLVKGEEAETQFGEWYLKKVEAERSRSFTFGKMDAATFGHLRDDLDKMGKKGKYASLVKVTGDDSIQVDPKLYNQFLRETTPEGQDPHEHHNPRPVNVQGQDLVENFGLWLEGKAKQKNAPLPKHLTEWMSKEDAHAAQIAAIGKSGKYAGKIKVDSNDHYEIDPELYNQFKRETTPPGETPTQFRKGRTVHIEGQEFVKPFDEWIQRKVEEEKKKGGHHAEAGEPPGPHYPSTHSKASLALNNSGVKAASSADAVPSLPIQL